MPTVPGDSTTGLIGRSIVPSFLIALFVYVMTLSLGTFFAAKNGYKVDPRQVRASHKLEQLTFDRIAAAVHVLLSCPLALLVCLMTLLPLRCCCCKERVHIRAALILPVQFAPNFNEGSASRRHVPSEPCRRVSVCGCLLFVTSRRHCASVV